MSDNEWLDEVDEDEGTLPCPDCGAEVHVEAEACPACGYWITDAERDAGWRDSSTSGRIRAFGLWLLALAGIGWLSLWWE